MPNYRQKNRNRNRNKNRNKQANQQHQQQQQKKEEEEEAQQHQKTLKTQQQVQKEAVEAEEVKAEKEDKQQSEAAILRQPIEQVVSIVENVEVKSLVENENESLGNDSTEQSSTAAPAPATDSSDDNESCALKNVDQNVKNLDEETIKAVETTETTETAKKEEITDEMGAKATRIKGDREGSQTPDQTIKERYKEMQPLRTIIATLEQQEQQEKLAQQQQKEKEEEEAANVIIHRIVREEPKATTPPTEALLSATQNTEVKVIFHRIELETEVDECQKSPKSTFSPTPEDSYHVESPINEFQPNRASSSSLLIQELSDASLSDTNDSSNEQQPPLISEADDSEPESMESATLPTTGRANDFLTPSILPKQPEILSMLPSLSCANPKASGELQTSQPTTTSSISQDDLRQRRVQKRAALESHFLPQLLSPRYLDCIIEENSDLSESNHSIPSTPQTPEAGDGGAIPADARMRRADARFPKSNLDFSRKHKHGQLPKSPTMPGAICEEPQAIIVETKHIEKSTTLVVTPSQTPTEELLTSAIVAPAFEAAEVVFIESASSSMSDLLEEFASSDADAEADMEDGGDDSNADADTTLSAMDLDTDVSDIMSYTGRNSSAASTLTGGSRENTPINQSYEPLFPTEAIQLSALRENRDEIKTTADSEIKLNDSGGYCTKSTVPRAEIQYIMDLFASPNSPNDALGNGERTHTALRAEAGEAVLTAKTTTIEDETIRDSPRSSMSSTSSGERVHTAAAAAIAGSSNLSVAENVDANSLLETLEAEMNNVRDVVSSLDELSTTPSAIPPIVPIRRSNAKRDISSQSPPPLPPPPSCFNEVDPNAAHSHNIYSNININTIQQHDHHQYNLPQHQQQQSTAKDSYRSLSQYTPGNASSQSTSFPTPTATATAALERQESADSHCSDSTVHSQCTAINLCASPCDVDVDVDFDTFTTTPSYISDTREKPSSSSSTTAPATKEDHTSSIKKLRHLCTETLASMPYGEDVLEELANVAQNISEVQLKQHQQQQHKEQQQQQSVNDNNNMPYPLPDMPQIDQLQLSGSATGKIAITPTRPAPPTPSLRSADQTDSTWLGMPTETDPKLLVCLSPAQRAYIEDQQQQPRSTQKPDELLDAHQKYIDRRGYHEYTKEQVRAMNNERLQEQQILETAAMMKKLRKSLTPPPPPVPPPPVPVKSSETAAKAQSQKKILTTNPAAAVSAATGSVDASKNDASVRNANEQLSATKTPNPFTVREHIISNDNNNNNNNNNKHRLLAIIHDDTTTGETSANELTKTAPPIFGQSSSLENNSRQASIQTTRTISSSHQAPFQSNAQHQEIPRETENSKSAHFPTHPPPNSQQPPATNAANESLDAKMQSVESELARMFPTMGDSNIFDVGKKRFSNIETSSKTTPFCSQLMSTQPKRYSNIETHSYETRKRTENGKVVYDFTDSKHESLSDGGEAPKTIMHFPVKADGKHAFPAAAADDQQKQQQMQANEAKKMPSSASHVEEIMSALKLNTKNNASEAAATAPMAPATAPPILSAGTSTASNPLFTSVTKQHKTEDDNGERHSYSTHRAERTTECFESNEKSDNNKTGTAEHMRQAPAAGSYEEFRQRAKAAADAIFSGDKHEQRQPSTFRNVDHEKLFKDFDELSNQLRAELETGKTQRVEREKSASLYDLNRMQMQFNRHVKDLKRQRHEHMQELEHEIERSMRSRQQRQQQQQQELLQQQQQQSEQTVRSYDIPIRIENGHVPTGSGAQQVYEVPIHIETGQPQSQYQVTSPVTPQHQNYAQESYYQDSERQFRRAESMFNLPTTPTAQQQQHQQQQQQPQQRQAPQQRERSYSNQFDGYTTADDWSRYASDLGSSENITRPFAREVEICYQRQRAPRTIRAPRLTVSTNDLSNNYAAVNTYDTLNAYNVRRTHAPMMSAAGPIIQKTKPQYLSCYSVLERDPNPTYISTTSRRGVSPAPPTSPQPPQTDHVHFNVSEREMRQRRASLPREIQEQQLKYIQSKEDELKTEFERLQNERRRLMDEMQREAEATSLPTPTSPPVITPPPRHAYRPIPPRRLPTLSEDEVFRQQMAEEWLNKVAEREERRLQKIIKISKSHEVEHARQVPIELTTDASGVKPDIESEFLKRVKERRTKLAMPADSDWESGAESQPQPPAGHVSETEDSPPMKIYEGKSEADLRHLPKHLREFAKFSNHQTEQIDGGQRELHQEEESRQEANDNSYTSASKKTSVMKTVKVTRQHPYAGTGHQMLHDGKTTMKGPNLSGDQHVYADPTTPTAQFPTSSTVNPSTTTTVNAAFSATSPTSPMPTKPTTIPTTPTISSPTISTTPTTTSAHFSPFLLDKLPTLTSSPFTPLTPFPPFGDAFANSPFKRKIFEEFDEFWRRFNSTASASTNSAFH